MINPVLHCQGCRLLLPQGVPPYEQTGPPGMICPLLNPPPYRGRGCCWINNLVNKSSPEVEPPVYMPEAEMVTVAGSSRMLPDSMMVML